MKEQYKLIKSMKEVPDQLRKLRREYIRYQQAELIYSLSHKKLLELASDAGAIFRIDSTVLIIVRSSMLIWSVSMNRLPANTGEVMRNERKCVDVFRSD